MMVVHDMGVNIVGTGKLQASKTKDNKTAKTSHKHDVLASYGPNKQKTNKQNVGTRWCLRCVSLVPLGASGGSVQKRQKA